MDKTIKTALEMHAVRDEIGYELAQVAALAKLRRHGHQVELHDSPEVAARIEAGRWIIDCECGAGNAVHPEFSVARCFGCGAMHKVKFPKDLADIEAMLLLRPQTVTRDWVPGETVATLRNENERHGVT